MDEVSLHSENELTDLLLPPASSFAWSPEGEQFNGIFLLDGDGEDEEWISDKEDSVVD